ncbi:ATP-binding cassette domain-containing protein [Pseudooceanicola sp. GBMRC 2024]|uniref:ATP-binding cassette domain-containing protein n=1 Tax=Pseudooceanicola albus TaxID=2692189 RepID=A0A6L7G2E7_9RHOB|nr:ABC transporter ATP-binding protein [Pseudooceanicola albus]MXN17892.1 ATP-binding cassette domain-containing protein [Pseudooceanicola albus]
MAKHPPVLELLNLEVGFPALSIVKGINLQIHQGEKVALVGESGCGKSLTAFSILRLLPQGAAITGGQVIYDGHDLASLPARQLRRIRGQGIALILQEPMTSLNPVLPIGLQVAENIRSHERISRRAAKERVIELLDMVGIPNARARYDAYPHNFSGGMRQRVMIAMAIACNPRLLIADEPTTALDVTIQAQVMDLLEGLCDRLNMAMLLITHDLGAVAQWADRVAVMYAGRIVEEAPIDAFFAAPQHPYSQGLMQSSVGEGWHYSDRRLSEVPGTVHSARGEAGCAFAPRCAAVRPTCRQAPPPLELIAPGRRAACFRREALSATPKETLRVTA